MSAFEELNWQRLDVHAIVGSASLATVLEGQRSICHEWLARNGYQIDTLDFSEGLSKAIDELGQRLNWEARFGYSLDGERDRNLDALRDGFEFDAPENGGRVFEILGGNLARQEDSRWFLGLLAIAQEHSRRHLALGSRFFALLVLPEKSPLIGAELKKTRVPAFYSPRSRTLDDFSR